MGKNCVRAIFCLFIFSKGGHTTEMLRLLSGMDKSYFTPRIYVSAVTDVMSEIHARAAESKHAMLANTDAQDVSFIRIARSREVKQSWLSTVFSSLRTGIEAVPLLLRVQPQMVRVCVCVCVCVPGCMCGSLDSLLTAIRFCVMALARA